MILEHLEAVRGLARGEAGLHRAIVVVLVDEASAVLLEDVKIGDQLFLEVLLDGEQQDLDVHGLALQLEPVVLECFDLVHFFLCQLDLELGEQRKCLLNLFVREIAFTIFFPFTALSFPRSEIVFLARMEQVGLQLFRIDELLKGVFVVNFSTLLFSKIAME